MTRHEHQTFVATWKHEAENTLKLLRALPADQYDFRPDPRGRSLGEMAWHLAEVDAYMAAAAASGAFDFETKPAGLERPRTVAELAPGYARVHAASLALVEGMQPADLERTLPSPMGADVTVSETLWGWLLHHAIHHRGQLSLMCRLAGGTPPGIYGPNREEMQAMRG